MSVSKATAPAPAPDSKPQTIASYRIGDCSAWINSKERVGRNGVYDSVYAQLTNSYWDGKKRVYRQMNIPVDQLLVMAAVCREAYVQQELIVAEADQLNPNDEVEESADLADDPTVESGK